MARNFVDAEVAGKDVRFCLTRKAALKLAPMRRSVAEILVGIIDRRDFNRQEIVAVLWATGRGQVSWEDCEGHVSSIPMGEAAALVAEIIYAALNGVDG